MQILKQGQSVHALISGATCTVRDFIGGGGQGEVYRANLSGNAVALKWYYPATATTEQRTALETLIRKGPPNSRFLWPLEVATAPGVSGFGYLMPLRGARFKGIIDLMKRRVDPSFRALATAGFELADSFLQMHAKGLCYRDISFGNVFFDPDTGSVLICDNDNVAVDGQAGSAILGTPRFMAPEIVRGETKPSTQTDLFSLAVLLFYLFIVHHPLEGSKETQIKCLDLPAMNRLYGTEPTFIFDPADASNRPVPGYHDNAIESWPIFPTFLQELFVRAFTNGIRDPQGGRVRESEWRIALTRLRDAIVYCECGAENFASLERGVGPSRPPICWSCRKEILLPLRIQIGGQNVWLSHDARLYPHHTDLQHLYDFSAATAEVSRHPTEPRLWGLKNLTSDTWGATMPDGLVLDVGPNRSVSLKPGVMIHFGGVEGLIQ